MSQDSYRVKTRRQARKRLEELLESQDTTIAIHYSCESFYDRTDGSSPRITSIAVRNLDNAQTTSFSIHQMAEIQHIPFVDIDKRYDVLEKAMLDQFYRYVEGHKEHTWLHWNMRDINYGFPAIAHRYRVLGGSPIDIHESNLCDLARLFVDLFGPRYAKHPRLESIMTQNDITNRDILTGQQEADAFKQKEYVKLHQSTLRKVDTFDSLVERLANRTIKTYAGWKDIHGGVPGVVGEFLRDHWVVSLFTFIATVAGFIALFFGK
jgi:hypothetical protein